MLKAWRTAVQSSTPPPKGLIELNNVGLQRAERQILRNICFTLPAQTITTLLGPNGAGKTSLIRLLVGLEQPSEGQILRQKGLKIGYVPQQLNLKLSLPFTVDRFLASGRAASADERKQALTQALAEHLLDQPMHSLSGGERQRVLLARALLGKPQLLVLDEPMQGIDIQGQEELYGLLAKIRDQHQLGLFVVSHDLHLVMSRSDYILCLNQHLCCQGTCEEVSQDPRFLQLFGLDSAKNVAVYQHRHDHHHGLNDCSKDLHTPFDQPHQH